AFPLIDNFQRTKIKCANYDCLRQLKEKNFIVGNGSEHNLARRQVNLAGDDKYFKRKKGYYFFYNCWHNNKKIYNLNEVICMCPTLIERSRRQT
ncbi:MAG: hypothetical protein ACP5SQ_01555, partial [Candidatus Saccharicenans sp.]